MTLYSVYTKATVGKVGTLRVHDTKRGFRMEIKRIGTVVAGN